MVDWPKRYRSSRQRGVLHTLAAQLRAASIAPPPFYFCSAPCTRSCRVTALPLFLRVLLDWMPPALGRNPCTFTTIGYGPIVLASVVMLVQGL